MSVHTPISSTLLHKVLAHFHFGELVEFNGILEGITNTIYRVKTNKNEYILTIFEELMADELPFYLELMNYLAERGYPSPQVLPDNKNNPLQKIHNKPAVFVSFLPGATKVDVSIHDCEAIGSKLAELHICALNFDKRVNNSRDFVWIKAMANKISSNLSTEDAELIKDEIQFQQSQSFDDCPKGIIHGDLFRDNVLFEDSKVTGVLDFYYACYDYLAYDVAITVNDWCLMDDFDANKADALLQSYQSLREFTPAEQRAWPVFLRRSALRYWLSRLHDFQIQTSSDDIQVKDPEPFKSLLLYHRITE